jgi:DNA gyrase inhibitor GyrI
MWVVIAAILVAGAVAWGPIMSDVEQATYRVVESHGAIEIREYAPMIVAQTEVSGEREEAIRQGFRRIADYIFGNNAPQHSVAMTAPVIQQPAEKIAMTAPVLQQGAGQEGPWKVRFVMPASYQMETLPRPNNHAVTLQEIPQQRFAVIRFSGLADDETLSEQTEILRGFMAEKQLQPLSPPLYAFFNPPWTLPPLRRNEVMIEIAGD